MRSITVYSVIKGDSNSHDPTLTELTYHWRENDSMGEPAGDINFTVTPTFFPVALVNSIDETLWYIAQTAGVVVIKDGFWYSVNEKGIHLKDNINAPYQCAYLNTQYEEAIRRYDADGNGLITTAEMMKAGLDFFSGAITKEESNAVIFHNAYGCTGTPQPGKDKGQTGWSRIGIVSVLLAAGVLGAVLLKRG